MNQDNDVREKAEKLVDFIIASDRLEGLETPSEDRELLIRIALGEIDINEYVDRISDKFRTKAEAFRAINGSAYDPSSPANQQPHPRFNFKQDTDNGEKTNG